MGKELVYLAWSSARIDQKLYSHHHLWACICGSLNYVVGLLSKATSLFEIGCGYSFECGLLKEMCSLHGFLSVDAFLLVDQPDWILYSIVQTQSLAVDRWAGCLLRRTAQTPRQIFWLTFSFRARVCKSSLTGV